MPIYSGTQPTTDSVGKTESSDSYKKRSEERLVSNTEIRDANDTSGNFLVNAGNAIHDFNNWIGTGIDDTFDNFVLKHFKDKDKAQRWADRYNGEDVALIPDILEDLGILAATTVAAQPHLGIGLLMAKGGLQNAENFHEAITGKDIETGDELTGKQRAAKGAGAAINTLIYGLPMPAGKVAAKLGSKAIPKGAVGAIEEGTAQQAKGAETLYQAMVESKLASTGRGLPPGWTRTLDEANPELSLAAINSFEKAPIPTRRAFTVNADTPAGVEFTNVIKAPEGFDYSRYLKGLPQENLKPGTAGVITEKQAASVVPATRAKPADVLRNSYLTPSESNALLQDLISADYKEAVKPFAESYEKTALADLRVPPRDFVIRTAKDSEGKALYGTRKQRVQNRKEFKEAIAEQKKSVQQQMKNAGIKQADLKKLAIKEGALRTAAYGSIPMLAYGSGALNAYGENGYDADKVIGGVFNANGNGASSFRGVAGAALAMMLLGPRASRYIGRTMSQRNSGMYRAIQNIAKDPYYSISKSNAKSALAKAGGWRTSDILPASFIAATGNNNSDTRYLTEQELKRLVPDSKE